MKWFSRERVSVFSEPERLVLDAVRTELSPDLWSIFDEHINTVITISLAELEQEACVGPEFIPALIEALIRW